MFGGLGIQAFGVGRSRGAPGGVSIEFKASAIRTADAATFTFTVALGGGRMVVGIGHREATQVTISSVTIGGVAAAAIAGTEVAFSASNLQAIAFYEADVPSVESGDIVVTLSGTAQRCSVGVWALRNTSGVVDSGTSIADPAADTITVPARGAIIGYGSQTHSAPSVTATWTGVTEHFDGTVEGNTTHTGASAFFAAGANVAVSCDWSATPATGGAAAFVSFGP
jgi:hypothetical protein